MLEQIHTFHQTKRGFITFGVIELVLLYIVVSIALDTASMWAYAAAIVLLVGTVMNIINAFTFKEGKQAGARSKHSR